MKFILTTSEPFVLVFDWLSCIKREYISGSQSKCAPQPHCGSVSRQDFDAPPSSLSQTSASLQSQHPGTRPCEAFQHPPASAPSTVNVRFNYLRTKFSKLQHTKVRISAVAQFAPMLPKGQRWYLPSERGQEELGNPFSSLDLRKLQGVGRMKQWEEGRTQQGFIMIFFPTEQ